MTDKTLEGIILNRYGNVSIRDGFENCLKLRRVTLSLINPLPVTRICHAHLN